MIKHKHKQLFLLLIFTLTLVMLLFPLNVKGITDIDYTINQELLYDDSTFNYNNTFNLENKTHFTQIYNATYSFTGETGLTGTSISYVDSDNDNHAFINSEINEHKEVLSFFDDGPANIFENDFSIIQKSGSIEFWWSSNDVSVNNMRFYIKEGASIIYFLRFVGGFIQSSDGVIALTTTQDNQWYHIRLDFFIDNTVDIYINTVLKLENEPFDLNPTIGIDIVRVRMFGGNDTTFSYFDAIGYSWDTLNPVSFDLISEVDNIADIAFDDTFFWIIDFDSQVFKYDSNWNYQGITYDWSAQDSESVGITFDGTFFWMCGLDTDTLYKYNLAGVYQNEFWQTNPPDELRPIDFKTPFYWLITSNDSINKYNSDLDFIFSLDVQSIMDTPYGVCSDGSNLWLMTEGASATMYKFDFEGNYLNINHDFGFLSTFGIHGIIFNDDSFWLSDADDAEVHQIVFKDIYYEIGNNLIPEVEINTSLLQISAYELAFTEIDNIHNIGNNNPENWTFDETGGGAVQVDYDWTSAVVYPSTTFFRDRTVSFVISNGDFALMNRPSLNIQANNFMNITFGVNITALWDAGNNEFHIEFYEGDDSSILTHLRFIRNFGSGLTLSYWNDGLITLTTDLEFNKYYDFNVLLNFEIGINIIRIIENGVYFDDFIIPFSDTSTGNKSLGNIEVKGGSDAGDFGNTLYLDYIGIFNNGTTQVLKDDSYGYVEIKLNDEWNFKHHNLLFFRGIGNIQIYDFQPVNNLDYVPAFATSHILDSFRQHNNTIITNNLYNVSQTITTYNQLIIYTTQNISYNYVSVEGVSITHLTSKHWLEFSYSNVNINESYFYATDSNRLNFKLNVDNTLLESIEARFNINDFSTNGYTTSFKSDIEGQAFGFFRLNFTDTSNIIPFPLAETTTRFIPTQNQTIKDVIILITDRNINTVSGLTSGFISNIKFIVSADIGLTILTTALIFMIIPLIMILVPSISISQVYGKMLLIPLFILMSIICVSTGLIPIWLFFIIIFSNVMFILKAKEIEGLD